MVPWGGPTLRAATALNVPVTDLFNPMIIPLLSGLATVFVIAFFLGKKEKSRLGVSQEILINQNEISENPLHRPRLVWVNFILILSAITAIILGWAPPFVIFMVGFALALLLNYPQVEEQKRRIDAHAKEAMLMASILFAAGCFTGILKGSGMMEAMAVEVKTIMPEFLGQQLPLLTGLLSMPASLLFDPDSFYFGILPLLSATATNFGASGLEVGQAAILGQMTTGFPISPLTGSTFLLVGLAQVELGDHQRKTIPLAFLVTIVMLLVSILLGIISI
jgi:CitMHS family citrate-Mg2+:H+ or citrate-Ca2+:H+ symporter